MCISSVKTSFLKQELKLPIQTIIRMESDLLANGLGFPSVNTSITFWQAKVSGIDRLNSFFISRQCVRYIGVKCMQIKKKKETISIRKHSISNIIKSKRFSAKPSLSDHKQIYCSWHLTPWLRGNKSLHVWRGQGKQSEMNRENRLLYSVNKTEFLALGETRQDRGSFTSLYTCTLCRAVKWGDLYILSVRTTSVRRNFLMGRDY